MRVIFMGTPDFSVAALDALHKAGHEIIAVYTQPPRPAGRGKAVSPSPVQLRAEAIGIPVRHPQNLRTTEAQQEFADLRADIAVVVAYGLILPQAILDAPRHGCLNIHASLLPRWRGAAPIHRAIMAGDTETGVCIMQMDAGLDTGPVLLRAVTPIHETDTTQDLHNRLAQIGAEQICTALERLSLLKPQTQATDGVTYAAKIDKSEAQVNFHQDAARVAAHIRGLSPFPGAWIEVAGERVKLLRAHATHEGGNAGEVLHGFTIACAQGAVTITEAQRQGRRPLPADEILNGLKL